jgi:hypothetical protein
MVGQQERFSTFCGLGLFCLNFEILRTSAGSQLVEYLRALEKRMALIGFSS